MAASSAPAKSGAATRKSAQLAAASARPTRTRSAAAPFGCVTSPIRRRWKTESTTCCCIRTRYCAASTRRKSIAPTYSHGCARWRPSSCPTPRREGGGWFDAVAVGRAIKTGGIDGIALTKLDVLDGFREVKFCTAYRRGGEIYDYVPAGATAQAELEPVYESAEGWGESTRGARSWADLPATAIKYIRRLEELIGAPVSLLSTSPEREDTVLVRDPFAD